MTEVAALDRAFDYEVTDATAQVEVGDRVRVNLHGRSVRGWVWESVEPDRDLKALTKWLGRGVPPSMLSLVDFCARRWCAPRARFLLAGSPDRIVTSLPSAPSARELSYELRSRSLSLESGVIRLAPTIDPLDLVLDAYESTRTRAGSLLVLVPYEGWARRLGGRLAQRGLEVAFANEWDKQRAGWPIVVGARGVAFAPVPVVSGAVIIDGDDESFRSEASPTWHASDVVRERCREFSAPYWFTSPLPSPRLRSLAPHTSVAPDEKGLWPRIEIVDRRQHDPREGVLSEVAMSAARRALATEEPVAVVVVLQRLGAGRLYACRQCGELARCAVCGSAEIENEGTLWCPEHRVAREIFCVACGSGALRKVRSGVTTLARDVGALLGTPTSEITAASAPGTPTERVVVGTEALWPRVRRAGVVVFADFDQYLLAPRERARRDAILAVAKAGRLVGSRRDGRGVVVLQTRRGNDPVLRALADVAFDELLAEDDDNARVLGLPPYGALAEISGEAASAFVASLPVESVQVSESVSGYVVRASSTDVLSDALSTTPRPAGRLRVAVD